MADQIRATQLLKNIPFFGSKSVNRKGWNTRPPPLYKPSAAAHPRPYLSQPSLALQMPQASTAVYTTAPSQTGSQPESPQKTRFRKTSDSQYEELSGRSSESTTPQTLIGDVLFESKDAPTRLPSDRPSINGQPLAIKDLPDIFISSPVAEPDTYDVTPRPQPTANSAPLLIEGSRDVSENAVPPISQTDAPSTSSPSLATGATSKSDSRSPPAILSMPPRRTSSLVEGVRLSPSIVYRQPPMPLNLPPLPPTPSDFGPVPRVPSRLRLRAMPALPRMGSNDNDNESDQEMDAEDDDEVEANLEGEMETHPGGASDEEEEPRPASQSSAATSPSSCPLSLLRVDVSGTGEFFDEMNLSGPALILDQALSTQARPSNADYFSSKPLLKPLPPNPSSMNMVAGPSQVKRESSVRSRQGLPSSSTGPVRVELYRHASKSMVNVGLSSTKRVTTPAASIQEDQVLAGGKGKGKGKATDSPLPQTPAPPESKEAEPLSSREERLLRRRSSMPIFTPAASPPPYLDFPQHPFASKYSIPSPMEEGKEQLPSYTNDIYLSAIMPRKLEFSAPGVQAKNRKWRRVLCILEGTVFKVYKCPAGALGVGLIGEWLEKKVGAGDATSQGPSDIARRRDPSVPRAKPGTESTPGFVHVRLPLSVPTADRLPPSPSRNQVSRSPSPSPSRGRHSPSSSHRRHSPSPSRSPTPPPSPLTTRWSNRSRFNLGVNLLSPRSHSRSRSDMPKDVGVSGSSPGTHRHTGSVPAPLPTSRSTGSSFQQPSSSRPSHFMKPLSDARSISEAPEPDPADLMRAYTLQHAESGLGNDYRKRKNVIRVRMEGEQFLLQARDVAAVVDWIEVGVSVDNRSKCVHVV
jgi:hypothetical protein